MGLCLDMLMHTLQARLPRFFLFARMHSVVHCQVSSFFDAFAEASLKPEFERINEWIQKNQNEASSKITHIAGPKARPKV